MDYYEWLDVASFVVACLVGVLFVGELGNALAAVSFFGKSFTHVHLNLECFIDLSVFQ